MITLGVRDLEVAINFYEQGLGFPRKKSSPDIAFFTLNGTWLALYNWDALARDAGVDSSGAGFGGFTLSHNVTSEKEVDKVYAAAVAAGASPVKKPQPASWGGYSGYFKDLDGYLWEVAFNPFTWIGPEDEKAPNIEAT
jgi:uncharacterized glyoxalase superfamily protein PhnB